MADSTVGREGLCPFLLVLGAITRLAQTGPSLTWLQKVGGIENAISALEKEQSKRRVAFWRRQPNGPEGTEVSERMRRLPVGSPVMVYRMYQIKCRGLFKCISWEGETAVFQLEPSRRIFRTHFLITCRISSAQGHPARRATFGLLQGD